MFPFTKLIRLFKKLKDLTSDTREKQHIPLIKNSYINIEDLNISKLDNKIISYLCKMYMDHRFDLLGSGWVRNSYDSNSFGFENYLYIKNLEIGEFDKEGNWLEKLVHFRHLKRSKEVWKQINGSYSPIDWQKDIKSGYRWSVRKSYKDQRNKYFPGADLKMPWEIARFYHLPQLAVFAISSEKNRNKFIIEFRNQVLDFISTNPPRMGVNWSSTMEVAIRATNFLIAYDLFSQLDNEGILDENFRQIFADSVYEHGKHIVNNLEYKKHLTSNHYLSNLAGLLFISAYLGSKEEISCWLLFSIQEILNELFKQFLPDGVNFESSTSYHRLSSELIILSISLILGLEKEKKRDILHCDIKKWRKKPDLKPITEQKINFENNLDIDEEIIKRLFKIGKFIKDITKSTNEIVQIGDNDNGRFLKLSPLGELITSEQAKSRYLHLKNIDLPFNEFWDENILDHTSTLAYFDGLFDSDYFFEFGDINPLEKTFVESICKNQKLNHFEKSLPKRTGVKNIFHLDRYRYKKEFELKPKVTKKMPLTHNLDVIGYFHSNFYIFRSTRLFLAINAMANGQNGNGGHCHNDKLSFELNFDGEDIIVDPGTYVYTPVSTLRNLFRSVKYHNTMVVRDVEQNKWKDGIKGLFSLSNDAACDVLKLDYNYAAFQLTYNKIKQIRIFEIKEDKIVIKDYSNVEFESFFNYFILYSNGYGKLINMKIPDDQYIKHG